MCLLSDKLSALWRQFKAETAKNTVSFHVISWPPFEATRGELADINWLCITVQRKPISHEIQISLSLSKMPRLLSIMVGVGSG